MSASTDRTFFVRAREGLVALVDRPVPAWTAAALRIVVAFALYRESLHNVDRLIQYTPGQYHLPWLPGVQGLSYATLLTLCSWQKTLALLALPGLFSRYFLAGAVACQGYLFAISALNFRNHIFLMCVLGVLAILSAPDRVLSLRYLLERLGVKALAPKSGPTPPWRTATIRPGALRLVQVQVFAVYFYAALHKHVEGFADGYPLCASFWRYFRTSRLASWLQAEDPAMPWLLGWITDDPGAFYLAIEAATERAACQAAVDPFLVYSSIATIVVEYLLAFGLLFRRVNYVVAALGLGMHLFIFFGMNVESFGWMMVGTYLIFFGAPPARAFVDGWRGAAPASDGETTDDDRSDDGGDAATADDATDANVDGDADASASDDPATDDAPSPDPVEPPSRRRSRKRGRKRG